MKDYRLTIRAHNNRILELIERTHDSVAAFARTHQLPYQSLSDLVRLTDRPRTATGEWRKLVIDLAAALRVAPEELFSARQMDGLRACTVVRKVDEEDMIELDGPSGRSLTSLADHPDEAFFRKEALIHLLPSLSTREKIVIEKTFGLNGERECTLDEIGARLGGLAGISKERVRQIQIKALRKLRDEARRKKMSRHDLRADRMILSAQNPH